MKNKINTLAALKYETACTHCTSLCEVHALLSAVANLDASQFYVHMNQKFMFGWLTHNFWFIDYSAKVEDYISQV